MALPTIDITAVNSSINKLPEPDSNTKASFTEAYLSLIGLLCFIILLGWIVKKLGANKRFKNSKHLNIIDTIPVGTKERIVLFQKGNKIITVGVTQHNISLLDTEIIEDTKVQQNNSTDMLQTDKNSNGSFKEKFDKLLNTKNKIN